MAKINPKVAVALVTHAPLGRALQQCAQHVLSHSMPDLIVADILATDSPEPWVEQLVQNIQNSAASAVLLLCDLYGSTPYNIATAVQRQLSLSGIQAHLLSGVNASMVVKALSDSTLNISIDELVQNALYATQRGMVHQAPLLPKH